MIGLLYAAAAALLAGCSVPYAAAQVPGQSKPSPTRADVSYGSHERHKLDFWQAAAPGPRPLVVFIHGGGFQSFSKERIEPAVLNSLLPAGISVAAVNYRYVSMAPFPACFEDVRRALQFLRAQAPEWRIDANRVGAYGGSAGAMLSMWLGFHDDMADANASDPIARQSTRLTAVATMGGQITFDRHWMEQSIPGGVVDKNPAMKLLFGVGSLEDLDKPPAAHLVRELSPITHLTADDPPVYMEYGMAPDDRIPADPDAVKPWALHHVIFGITLHTRMAALGIESDLRYPGASPHYKSIPDFFIAKLRP
jgi:acetyl esterase